MTYLIIVFLFTAIAVSLALAGIGIKIFLKKNGEFKKQCGVIDPAGGKRTGCACNKSVSEDCKKGSKYQPLEINKEIFEEL